MVYRFGDCTLDTQRHRLQRSGQPVRLRPKAFQVLRYLLEQRDRTVLKSELRAQAWPQQFISDATLDSTVRAVRQAIGDRGSNQQLIQTVYGYGYRFIAAVEVCADVPAGTAGEPLRSLPGSASAPPPNGELISALVPLTPESAAGANGRRVPGVRDEGQPTPQNVATEPAPERPAVPSPVWEQKPVAVLTVELTFPTTTEGEAAASEPWRAASCWEQAFMATVQRFGGVVLQRSPSLLLVAFGIPQTLEQLPQRAVQAALALRHLVEEVTDREPCPELRQVVHWGPLLVDVHASDPTAQLRAVGETLAWPVRLLGQTAPGEILLSPEVGLLAEGWCEVQAREVSLQAGQPGRIQVYTLVGDRLPWARLEMQGRRPLSRFVGRERQLALLREILPQVESGRGQVVGVIGEPGVGKSRLCYEFIRGSLTHPWLILATQGTAYGKATPYLPIIDLLKGYFRLEDRDDWSTVRDKVTDKLRGLAEAFTPTAPAFLTLLDVPIEDPQWQTLEVPQRRQRTLGALNRILLWESQVQPLLLVVENLHWIDAETQAVLDTLVENLPAGRLFLLTTYRPEYRHEWVSKTYYTQLRLDPLPRERARELVDALLGNAATLEPLKQRLVERTQGNPFFLEESIRSMVETQVLVSAQGAFHLGKTLPSIQVSSSVQTVLAARIDRLPPEEKRLLQTAAVIGTEVAFPLLQAVADLPEEGLRTGLAHLQGAEFLYETRLFPELVYTFKHVLTQEVAYDSLLQDQRRALHGRIIEAIEKRYTDRLATQVGRLAQHAFRGEVWDKALSYSRQAGSRAGACSAYQEAVVSFEQALKALTHLPESRDTLEQAIDLRLSLRTALLPFGELRRIHRLLRDAATLAETLGDQRRLGLISTRLCHASWQIGDYKVALEFGQRALAISIALGDVRWQRRTNVNLADTYHALSEYGRAIACYRTAVSLEGGLLPRPLHATSEYSLAARAKLSQCLAELGAFAEGISHGEEGIRMAEAADHPFSRAAAYGSLGNLYVHQGAFHKAIPLLERAIELCQVWQIQLLFPSVASPLGVAYALSGRVIEALPLLEQAVEQSASMQFTPYISRSLASLSEGCLLAGRPDEAIPCAQRALKLARQHKERGIRACVLRLLGEIAAQRELPEVEPAEEHYRQALALAEELGMCPLVAHCHLGLGRLYGQTGHGEEARPELSAAIDLYRAMDMTFWLPQAEAMLAQVEGR
jgi:DNA-binding winged helix-turn-helix (wHTH) protein/tetratricopeptide (TPR) repeat protein